MRDQWRDADLAAALRWLGAPVTVACLGLLALNDQVLKQAWPGFVTGKLSDVVGLVVAPALLGVVLVALRVPWAPLVSLAATGVGFTLTKSSETGAEAASAVWSLTGVPTRILADPTDLLALPALLVAARVWVLARAEVEAFRRRLHVVLGAVLLPPAVLTTAATSCAEDGSAFRAYLATGDFAGPPRAGETLLVVDTNVSLPIAVGPTGEVRSLSGADDARLGTTTRGETVPPCDPADPLTCWRAVESGYPAIETSSDGGRTWRSDFEMSDDEGEALADEIGDQCGDPPRLGARDLAVLGTPYGPIVVVPSGHAGVMVLLPGDDWQRLTIGDLEALAGDPERGRGRGRIVIGDTGGG